MRFYLKYIFLISLLSSCAFEEPYFMTISIYNCERIAIDDKFASSEEIPIAVYLETKDLDSIRKSKFFVKLKIAEDASMGQIEMVENELKKAHIFNVKYYTVENLVCDY